MRSRAPVIADPRDLETAAKCLAELVTPHIVLSKRLAEDKFYRVRYFRQAGFKHGFKITKFK